MKVITRTYILYRSAFDEDSTWPSEIFWHNGYPAICTEFVEEFLRPRRVYLPIRIKIRISNKPFCGSILAHAYGGFFGALHISGRVSPIRLYGHVKRVLYRVFRPTGYSGYLFVHFHIERA